MFPLIFAQSPMIMLPELSIFPFTSPSTRIKPFIFISPETKEPEPMRVLIEMSSEVKAMLF